MRRPSCGVVPSNRSRQVPSLSLALAAAALALVGCDDDPTESGKVDLLMTPPGPGVVFSYPNDGQYDVTTGTTLLLAFSAPLPSLQPDAGAAGYGACSKAGEVVTGTFCVEGPEGFVDGHLAVDGARLAFTPAGGFAPGSTYRVYARPELLPGSTNLGAPALLTFHTRSERPQSGAPARVITVNGQPLTADGGAPGVFLDEAPVRLLFSEPVDVATLTSANARLMHVADSTSVEGTIASDGVHLTFSPAAKLVPGDVYQLVLTDGVRDVGGEAIAPVSLTFTPRRMAVPDAGLYPLNLTVEPPWTDGVSQPQSHLALMEANTNVLSAPLMGTNTMGVMAGGLETLVGDPQVMGTPIPMLIRRGQRLDLTSLPIRFGGVLAPSVQTGTIHFTMLTDATGVLMRNPLRPPNQTPDDAEAPVYVDLTMDAVVTSDDVLGNVIATQTVMGIRLYGNSTLDGDQLAIEQAGAMDFSTLGINVAPVSVAMRLRTGSKPAVTPLAAPLLLSSFPAPGATAVPPDATLELNYSAPLDPARLRDGVELTLTQGANVIPTTTQLKGGTLVIRPSRRLDDGVAVRLNYTGLRSLFGDAVTDGSISFSTAALAPTQAAPPILTALTPGAPCALTGSGAGRCVGGLSTDSSYQPFTLPSNHHIHAQFSQPMDPTSLTLGTACGQGSVRVEALNASGQCTGVVAGTLLKADRAIHFVANQPWTVGASYRLTLVAGTNTSCTAGEMCGRNRQPLNTDPLAGATASAAGGPDVVIRFTATPATPDSFQALESEPFADLNGNGYLDAVETTNEKNRVVMELGGFGGIVTDAELVGEDCMPNRPGQQVCSYVHATLPSSIGGALEHCPIDGSGHPAPADAPPCIQVRVYPNTIVGTSITMNTLALGIIPIKNLPTGVHAMRLREMGAPIYGYILREPGDADPQFVITNHVYFDNPDISIPLATNDLHSKELLVTLKGPVTFRPDGRMDVALRSTHDVTVQANISALFLPGNIDLKIPAGEMRITLAGALLR